MRIDFNPHAAAQTPSARPPQAQNRSATTAPAGSDDGVAISLSPAAEQALKVGASEHSGNSPAQMARQYIAQGLASVSTESAGGPDLTGPFGQIVKTFAPGHNKGTADTGDAIPDDGGDTAGVTEPTDGGETTVVAGDPDGTVVTDAPPLVVDEPDVTEVLDAPAPAEGEVTEPESGMAGSGDAVASIGDDAPVDEGTPVDSVEPVAIVDAGDLTDELLDLLDDGSEETV